MDAWNPDQLKRMQLGGNDKLNAFLKQYGVAKATEVGWGQSFLIQIYDCKFNLCLANTTSP